MRVVDDLNALPVQFADDRMKNWIPRAIANYYAIDGWDWPEYRFGVELESVQLESAEPFLKCRPLIFGKPKIRNRFDRQFKNAGDTGRQAIPFSKFGFRLIDRPHSTL